jgi:myosin heavy subunit
VPKNQQSLNDALDDRSATQRILQNSEIYEHRYRLGLSQILLRSDVLLELEERRDLCLSGLILSLQVQCRRCLASRWLEKRRLQEKAVKCLQRNINVHAQLKSWPWWKLYLNVLPLLNQARFVFSNYIFEYRAIKKSIDKKLTKL